MDSGKKKAFDYINNYQKENYDRITLLRGKGEKEKLTKIANDKGYKSLNGFINACIDEKINAGENDKDGDVNLALNKEEDLGLLEEIDKKYVVTEEIQNVKTSEKAENIETNNVYNYKSNLLKNNIDVLTETFLKYGLTVLNISDPEYGTYTDGSGIKFYIEIHSETNETVSDYFQIKINIYDEDGKLISMGSEGFSMSDFTGYDTFSIVILSDMIQEKAASAKIYLSKK